MQKHTLIILVVLFTSLLFIVTLLKYLTTTTSKSHHHPVVHKVDKSPKPHFSSLSGGKISDILPKNLSNSLTKYDNSIKEREYALAKLHRYHSNRTSDENTRHSIHSHPPPHPHPHPHPWGPGGPSTPVDPVPWMPGSDASINTLLSNITSQSSSHQTLDDDSNSDSNSGSNSNSNSGSNSSNTSHNSHTQKSIIYPDSHPANSSHNTKHHHLLGDRLRHFGTHLLRIGRKEHGHHKHIW